MNMCVLVLGMWFLKLDNGYGVPNYIKANEISDISSNDTYTRIYTLGATSYLLSGWLPAQNRYMTSQEVIDLMQTCHAG